MPSHNRDQGRNQNCHPVLMFEMSLRKCFYKAKERDSGHLCSSNMSMSFFLMSWGKSTLQSITQQTTEMGADCSSYISFQK